MLPMFDYLTINQDTVLTKIKGSRHLTVNPITHPQIIIGFPRIDWVGYKFKIRFFNGIFLLDLSKN